MAFDFERRGKRGADIEQLIDNHDGFERVQELRSRFRPELIEAVQIESREEAVERGSVVIEHILKTLKKEQGAHIFDHMDPGHGSGHLTRDYIAALQLAHGLDEDPRQLFVGLVGGVMHDLGCAFVKRYDEPSRSVRHAEAGALVVDHVLRRTNLVNEAERTLVAHGVSASTHYLQPQQVNVDGRVYTLQPYQDEVEGQAIPSVWLPRWADRLDCSGAAFVGRHFLTQHADHKDFDGSRYYDTSFASHLQAVRRTPEEIKAAGGKRTMVEHLNMFAQSQTNASAYGKHDRGVMVTLRDAQRARLNRIIDATLDDDRPVPELSRVIPAWTALLTRNVEPHAST